MTSIPPNLGRAPTLLAPQMLLANLNRTNLGLLEVQNQLATGRAVSRPSDDALRSATISALEQSLERSQQRTRNLSSASGTLAFLDSSLADANEMLLEAKGVALSQIGTGSDTDTRRPQAEIIDAMIDQLYQLSNRKTNGLYIFGGATASTEPIQEMYGGYRYMGNGSGLRTDLDLGDNITVTIGGNNAIGETSARHRSVIDLDPDLTPQTLLRDLNGATGQGVNTGRIAFSLDGGPDVEVDLDGARDVQDVLDRINGSLLQYQIDTGTFSLPASALGADAGNLQVSMLGAPPSTTLQFTDVGLGTAARDLGLTGGTFDPSNEDGIDLDPRLTTETQISALPTLTTPLSNIRIAFGQGDGRVSFDVDLSGAQSIDEVRNIIETTVPGTRVVPNEDGTGIDIYNEVAGPTMFVEEIAGGPNSAQELGLRTLTGNTKLDTFNNGRGVGFVTGGTHPVTGLADPARDIDFTITLGNGDSFDVNLRPQDIGNVDDVIARINEEANTAVLAGRIPPTAISAGLATDGNGIALSDNLALGQISIEGQNNSPAANDLGLLDGDFDGATFVAQDRAGVRVDSLFTRLMDLRDALFTDDETGITLAAETFERDLDRISGSRALVGVSARRTELAVVRQDELRVLDQQLKSEFQDLDFAEAAVRFNLLQTQLSAATASGAQTVGNTLLDFLR